MTDFGSSFATALPILIFVGSLAVIEWVAMPKNRRRHWYFQLIPYGVAALFYISVRFVSVDGVNDFSVLEAAMIFPLTALLHACRFMVSRKES